MFGSHISLTSMTRLCQSLGTMLNSGLAVHKALEIASRKTGDARCRRVLARVTTAISNGSDVSSAFREQGEYFPELFVDMVDVAEQSGNLPEVLARLADHYENLVRLRRSFSAAIAWPIIQLVAAILIVAFVIFILGIIGDISKGKGGEPVDMLGLGLLGPEGAIIWLCMTFGTIAAIIAVYLVVAKVFRQQRFLDSFLLHIPVVGKCMRSFAIARFSWGYALTQQAGMPIARSLEASLKATGNGAFVAATAGVCNHVLNGDELSEALDATRLFPEDYLHMVQVSENTGTVPELFQRLSPDFEEQARRSLRALTATLGWLAWLGVAGLIIFIVFRVMMTYVGMINELSR